MNTSVKMSHAVDGYEVGQTVEVDAVTAKRYIRSGLARFAVTAAPVVDRYDEVSPEPA